MRPRFVGPLQEVISLVGEEGLVLDSQAGRSVGYRQALEFLSSVWGSPGGDGGAYTCTAKVRVHGSLIPRCLVTQLPSAWEQD